MRKALKESLLKDLTTIYKAHNKIKGYAGKQAYENIQTLLLACKSVVLQMQSVIKESEGEECKAIVALAVYNNTVDEVLQNNLDNCKNIKEALDEKLKIVENVMEQDIPVKLLAVFMPYKASMWDSLESVWLAAKEDPDCEAVVVPIPYFDKNPIGDFAEQHYEGELFPDYVPIVDYKDFDVAKERPDMIYIHNPYDEHNFVTSIDPRFYSYELKKHTECLVYIPYYATSGVISDVQGCLSAYNYADYIITQAEHYKNYFHPALQKKVLAFGSPKFDRVINMQKNMPELPEGWKEAAAGRKVFFYNTSLNGMLRDTENFMKKMKYVFETFAKHPEVCLLWRPHPLFEATLDSLRPDQKKKFEQMKEFFVENNIGIYDKTPDVTVAVAFADAYIGDGASSITSLFGVSGKPLFIFNNKIDREPTEQDKKIESLVNFNREWLITPQNKVYHSSEKNYNYQYCGSVSEYTIAYYNALAEVEGKTYVLPKRANDIVILNAQGVEKRISIEKKTERSAMFANHVVCGTDIFLIGKRYPAIVHLNTKNNKVSYLTKHLDVAVASYHGENQPGGMAAYKGNVYMASPVDNRVLVINAKTGEEKVITLPLNEYEGCFAMTADKDCLWLMPMVGTTVVAWQPETGNVTKYSDMPEGLVAQVGKFRYNDKYFNQAYVTEEFVILPPYRGNMFIKLNKKTGKAEEWKIPVELPTEPLSCYSEAEAKAEFLKNSGNDALTVTVYSTFAGKLYEVNPETNECKELSVVLDIQELEVYQEGFSAVSDWMQYACCESACNTLSQFVSGTLNGHTHEFERQIQAYGKVNASPDGDCGKKVYEFMKKSIWRK